MPEAIQSSKVTLIGFPYDASSSFLRGAASAPSLIRQALFSPATNSWSEVQIDVINEGILFDAGDIVTLNETCVREQVEDQITQIFESGGLPLSLGGDHSLTFPILCALGQRYSDLTLVQFDAHPDLYDEFEGDRFSHACQFARIMEKNLVRRLVQIGIRTMNKHQQIQADRFGIEVIDMRAWERGIRPALGGKIYLSIDMDAFDPAFAPGVSHREAGGLTSRDVINAIQILPGKLIGADIVEFNPTQDSSGITAHLCAKLVKELVSRMLQNDLMG